MMGVSELGLEEVGAENLADATEADLAGDEAGPAAKETEGGDEEDLARFDEDEEVRGYGVVIGETVGSMEMAAEEDNVVMEDV